MRFDKRVVIKIAFCTTFGTISWKVYGQKLMLRGSLKKKKGKIERGFMLACVYVYMSILYSCIYKYVCVYVCVCTCVEERRRKI
jgi:hypothetical protein